MNNKEKNIVLIGLTGCGKTTVGKMLAQKIDYDFIDMDDFIIESTGKTVPELFAVSEEYFRSCETKACKALSNKRKTVIASGGGAVKKQENMKVFHDNSIIIFLDRPVNNIVGDVEIKNRPLLVNGPNILYRLHDERYDLYKNQCHYRVENDKTLDELVNTIITIINNE
ncbi:shikimate kinase [uncultured Clostridium sp.]|uniref:shikimate kinase n=1 Tax=uncultured Clostridium sp. TaxID=59620 RepID=UPI002673A964|nr:shikimate kinase [uncultured Clostridium sp.]